MIKNRMSDQTKSMLVRMWFAGIVCFFIAWTPIGGGQAESEVFLLQMIIMLSFGLFITNMIIVNPVIRGMFKTKLDFKLYFEQHLLYRSFRHIGHLITMVFITTLIWLTYMLINLGLLALGFSNTTDRPLIMLEPITFGLMYGLYYFCIESMIHKLKVHLLPKEQTKL